MCFNVSFGCRVDAIYISTDNTVVSALSAISEVASDKKIPIMSADPSSAEKFGVLAAWGFDYYKLGRATGKMIEGIFVEGCIYDIMALGVFITFRVLDFPDLTVDDTFPLGAAIMAAFLINGYNLFLALFLAFLGGTLAGMLTALMHNELKIPNLLAGILTMILLYSVNPKVLKIIGVGLSNGLVAVSGAFAAQYQNFADIGLGQGIIIAGLASVMIGEFLIKSNRIFWLTLNVILGSIIFTGVMYGARILIFDVPFLAVSDLKLVQVALVAGCLAATRVRTFCMKKVFKWPVMSLYAKMRAFFRDRLKQLDMDLEHGLKDNVGFFSGGQRQALTLLMIVLSRPDLVLLDEHTAALDPKNAELVLDLTTKFVAGYRLTTMMITHNMSRAIRYGNRLLMMDKGEIILDVEGAVQLFES